MSGLIISIWLLGITVAILAQPVAGPIVYYMWTWFRPENQMYGGLSIRWGFLIAGASLVSYLYLGKRRVFPANALTLFLILFMLWYLASALVNDVSSQDFTLATDFCKVILMCLITASVINTRTRIHALIWIVVISLGSFMLWSGLRVMVGASGQAITGPGVASYIHETNGYARAIIYTVPLMAFLARYSAHAYVRWGLTVLSLLSILGMIGTNSRGAIAAFGVQCFVLWLYSAKKVLTAIVAVSLVAGFLLFIPEERQESFTGRTSTIAEANEDASFLSRTRAWEWGWDYALKHPYFGGGPSVYERIHRLASHNSYLEVLGESGFIGLGIWSMIGILTLKALFRIRRLSRGIPELVWADDLAFCIMISLVGYFAGGLLHNHGLFEYYYMLIAIVMGTEIAVRNYLVSQASEEDRRGPQHSYQQQEAQEAVSPSMPARL